MKKLKTTPFQFRSEKSFFSILQKSLFILLLSLVTLTSANSVPSISFNNNMLTEDIVSAIVSLPPHRIDSSGVNALFEACALWSNDINGHPAPSEAGIPIDDCANASITYVDVRTDGCSDVTYTLVRTWTIVDSCNLNTLTMYDQNITVGDTSDPIVTSPGSITENVPLLTCLIDIDVVPMTVVSECSDWDYKVFYKLTHDLAAPTFLATGDSTSGYVIEDIISTQDTVWVIYEVTDDCGNIDTVYSDIKIDNTLNTGPLKTRISGARVTCVNSTEVYSMATLPGATYIWNLVSGGNINGASNTPSITIDWGSVSGSGYELSVELTSVDGCVFTDTINVLVGTASGSVQMTNNINFSLGANGALKVTPQMIAAGPLPADGAFEVILMDDAGNEIVDATITCEYVGWPIMTILRNVCSGNSAMGTTYVFDKMGPVLTCVDQELFCYEVGNDNGPVAVDNCDGVITMTLLDSVYTPLPCNLLYIAEIEKTYIAYDQYGNASIPCTYSILMKRYPMDDIVGPADLTIVASTALECGTFDVDENGNPAVSVTGAPTLYGNSIYPTVDQMCRVGVGYTDNIINSNPCNTKIMRTWTVFESYCTLGNLKTYTQVIEITDSTPPVLTCLTSMQVTTNGTSCYGNVNLPSLTATDLCSTNLTYDVVYPGGSLIGQNGGLVVLPVGINSITYTVTDQCNNQTSCSFDVVVEDLTPPVAVLFENVTVSLTDDGTAWFPVSSLNAGSFDDCALLKIEAMRMDEGAACDIIANTFEENLHFCCADVDNEVMVIVRLTDIAGNTNEAMVSIQVQDKTPPLITCPADATVDCGYVFDLEDFSAFGFPIVDDACDDSYSESISSNISICGIGYYDRTFTASDGVASCTQRINVVPTVPFDYNAIDWPDDYFPTNLCTDEDLVPNNLPAIYAYPSTAIEVCQLIGFSYKDTKYTTSNACFKIIRRWTVTDGCDDLNIIAPYDQTIMVTNDVPPVITSSCDAVEAISDNCNEGDITLSATATDDCTPGEELFNTYKIDIDNDGTYETTVNGVGASMELTDVFPLGTHKIAWIFEDKCGNVETCTQEFSIINTMNPIAYCLHGLSVGLEGMDTDGDGEIDTEMACISAKSFDGGSTHPCGYDVTVSFSPEITDTILCVTCEDVGDYTVTLYVTDVNGTSSFCTTILEVQDNNDIDICKVNCDLLVHPADNFEVNSCGDDLSPETINSLPIVLPTSPCQDYDIEYTDEILTNYSTDDCFYLIRSWTVVFNCGSEETCEFSQTIIRNNYVAPVVTCPTDITVNAPTGTCDADVALDFAVAVANCNTGVVVINDYNNGGEDASGSYPIGSTTVVYTVSDDCDNTTTCSMIVIVIDGDNPVCNTQDITVSLGADGIYNLAPSEINNGSSDDCGGINMTVFPSQFDCDDLGENTVTLTVTDENNNTTTCTAIVTVEDDGAPICNAQNVTIQLDANGNATVTADEVDNGSSNACTGGGDVMLAISPSEFDCSNVGENSVTLTVTADNGQTSTCTATVTVEDNISPICLTQNFTISVGDTLLVSDIDNGSNDECTDVTMTVSPNVFDCDDVGEVQIVTLTVTDTYGNSSTCEAEVTVIDNGAPICNAQNVTIQLDANGNATVTADEVDNGSSSACNGGDDVTLSITPSEFDCSNVGENSVTLTVTADNGETSTCTATVTVEDNISPICLTQNFTINVGDTLLVSDIDNGSNDECTDVTMTVSPNVFDCDDVSEVQIVTLTVTDTYGNSSTCEAEVTVIDNGAPICNAQNVTIQLDTNGNATVTADEVDNGSSSACNGGDDVTLSITPSEFDCSNVGENSVTLTVTADNGQTSTCTATVTVEDNESPICSAQDTVVYLDVNGFVTIDTSFIDSLSSDNCGIDSMNLSQYIFDCSNVGENIVTLTVYDINGNSSICDATVLVVDTIGASCSTQNITVSLDANGEATILAEDVDNGSTSGSCGGTVNLTVSPSEFDCSDVGENIVTLSVTINGNTTTCSAIVTITESAAPILSCPADTTLTCNEYDSNYAIFGIATATDNCDSDIAISEFTEEDLNSCSIGTVTRMFIATDDAGNTDTCMQILTFELGADPLELSDIIFPTSPITVFNCGSTDPVDTGIPVVNSQNADCSVVSIDYSDIGNGDGCDDEITRTWTVIDSCLLDGSGAGEFEFVQIINVIDEEAPVLVGPADTTIILTIPNCDGYVDLSDVVATDCHIVTLTNNSPYADDNNTGDASGTYLEGITTYTITATDECGNISTDEVTVEVINGENIFTCKKIFFIMDDDLEVLINSYQFVDAVYGCGYENGDLTFSFSNVDENEFLDTLTCDDINFNININIYAYLDNVLYDSCSTIAHLTDPDTFCVSSLVPGIAGIVYSSKSQSIDGVNIGLEGDQVDSYMTDDSGVYEFMNVETYNSYNIRPFKNDDIMNGVSTLDLIMIQRHILGLKKFDSPYKMIAADINNNGKINATDIIGLRKLILGKSSSFKNNTSWRFLDANHDEWDESTILDEFLPEEYYINSLNNMMYINWIGVKVGDVNESAAYNSLSVESNGRFKETNILVVDDRSIKEGEEFVIDFKSDKNQSFLGLQFTLSFDPNQVNYTGIENNFLEMGENNVGDILAERGHLSVSWNSINDTELKAGDNILSMKFIANRDMKLSECFQIDSKVINAEWYDDTTKDLQIVFNNTEVSEVQLLSNSPNPWSDYTDINFFLPSDMNVSFTIYDVNGRKLVNKNNHYDAGLNTIKVDKSDVNVSGVLYYEIKTSNTKIVKKMILLNK